LTEKRKLRGGLILLRSCSRILCVRWHS
jgi:hypothetical protein